MLAFMGSISDVEYTLLFLLNGAGAFTFPPGCDCGQLGLGIALSLVQLPDHESKDQATIARYG
jgi:hypothetical protein